MLKLQLKRMLALFLCAVLIRPTPIVAEPTVLGSLTPRGVVNVGDVRAPGMSALFSGDQVRTRAGSALIQYQDGSRVVLGIESQASFSSERIELQRGQMSFSTEAGGPQFAASTLRIEPIGSKSAANVTYMDHKATVSVTEGSLRVVDPSGVQLASLRAGEARLFEEALAPEPGPPSAAAPPAVPPAPQIGAGGSNRTWLLALGIGIVGTSLGIAGLVRASDADDRADDANQGANQARAEAEAARAEAAAARAQAAQVQSQLTTLQAQNTALQAQANALAAQLAALSSSTLTQAQVAALASAISAVNAVQNRLANRQQRISELFVISQTRDLTSAERQELDQLLRAQQSDTNVLQQATNDANQAIGNIGGTVSTTRLP